MAESIRRPLKTTFDMTTLIFSTGGCPSYPFYSFKTGPWYPVFRENPSREVATKDHSSSNPAKGNPRDLKTKVDVSKVDVKGFPNLNAGSQTGGLSWAVIWGGAKRMGGGKRTRERALPKIFGPLQKSCWSALSWTFVQEKQSTENVPYEGGSKTPFWQGCHS